MIKQSLLAAILTSIFVLNISIARASQVLTFDRSDLIRKEELLKYLEDTYQISDLDNMDLDFRYYVDAPLLKIFPQSFFIADSEKAKLLKVKQMTARGRMINLDPSHPTFKKIKDGKALASELLDRIAVGHAMSMFCFVRANNYHLYSYLFGNLNRNFESKCSNSFESSAVFRFSQRKYLKSYFQPKQYIFIFSDKNDSSLSSWSNKRGRTYFFIDSDTSDDELARMFFHEVLLEFDIKNALGLGLWAEFGKATGVSLSSAGSQSQIIRLLRNPLVRISAQGLRLLNLERIQFDNGSHVGLSDCGTQLGEVLEQFKRDKNIAGLLAEEGYDPGDKIDIDQLVADIVSRHVVVNGKDTGLCEFLVAPLVSSPIYDPFASGPRPRFTGGWGGGNSDKNSNKFGIDYTRAKDSREYLLNVRPDIYNRNEHTSEVVPLESIKASDQQDRIRMIENSNLVDFE